MLSNKNTFDWDEKKEFECCLSERVKNPESFDVLIAARQEWHVIMLYYSSLEVN